MNSENPHQVLEKTAHYARRMLALLELLDANEKDFNAEVYARGIAELQILADDYSDYVDRLGGFRRSTVEGIMRGEFGG